jgi:hypothetical protein
MKDMSGIMKKKHYIFRYLTKLYGDMKNIDKLFWDKNDYEIKVPYTISNTTPLTEEIQIMFELDIHHTNDIINQWFRRYYHIDLFNKNKTKILQKKLKRWVK